VLYDPLLAPGSRSLADLIPSGARWSGWQLLVAFGLYALWRGRRFGRPVPEPQPVELPGSLLVRATAELQRRAGGHAQASAAVRGDLQRRLRQQLRVPPDLAAADLAGWVARREDLDPAVVQRAVLGPPASGAGELAALLADVDAVNRAVRADQAGGGGGRTDPRPAGDTS
jgi:hypothetical protein